MKPKFKTGEVYSWQEPDNKYRTIAAMAGGDGYFYQVAVHHRGKSNVGIDKIGLWYSDELKGEEKDFRKATEPEIVEFVTALVKYGASFMVTDGIRITTSYYYPLPTKQKEWWNYLKELCSYHLEHGSISNASSLRRKYHIKGLTTEQFYKLHLDKAQPEDINMERVIEIMDFVYNKK